MSRMNVTAAVKPAYRHMVSLLFEPFNLKKWLALGVFPFLMECPLVIYVGIFFYIGLSYNSTGGGDKITQWMQSTSGFATASVIYEIIALCLAWVVSIFYLVYTNQVTKDPGAIKEPFSHLKKLGTSLFLGYIGCGISLAAIVGALVLLPIGLADLLNTADWVQTVANTWGMVAYFIILLPALLVGALAFELGAGVMYTRRVKVLEAWRMLWPHIKENAGQSVLYTLSFFAFYTAIGHIAVLAACVLLILLAIPFGGIFLIAMLIGKSGGLVWNTTTITISTLYVMVSFEVLIYAVACAVQPAIVFTRSFSLAVLGQMDESFATIPTGLEPISGMGEAVPQPEE